VVTVAFDVVAALVAWLPGAVGAPAFAEVPGERPGEFVTVERTGGGFSVGVDRPALAVQAWAASNAEAAGLALRLRDALALRCAAEVPQVCRCGVEGLYSFPDPDSRQSRYQLSVYMTTRP
jgi:hypothetical protein